MSIYHHNQSIVLSAVSTPIRFIQPGDSYCFLGKQVEALMVTTSPAVFQACENAGGGKEYGCEIRAAPLTMILVIINKLLIGSMSNWIY